MAYFRRPGRQNEGAGSIDRHITGPSSDRSSGIVVNATHLRAPESTPDGTVQLAGIARYGQRLIGAVLVATLALTGGKVREVERVRGAALTQTQPLQGKVRQTERLRGATLSVNVALTGRVRETERLRGASLTQTQVLAGRIREVERLRGAALTQSQPLTGRVREVERLRGATLTATQPLTGRVREVERLRGATLSVAAGGTALAGTVRSSERLRAATLTQAQPLAGRIRSNERLKGATLSVAGGSGIALTGTIRQTQRLGHVQAPLTVFSDSSDGYILSQNATYLTARAGSGLTVDTTAVALAVATLEAGGSFDIQQGFAGFDTSSIPDTAVVGTPILSVDKIGFVDTSTGGELRVREHDWGAALTTADYVPGANLTGKTLLASKLVSTLNAAGTYTELTSGAGFAGAINKTGTTRVLFHISGQESTTPPGAGTGTSLNVVSSEGTLDPKLVVPFALAFPLTQTQPLATRVRLAERLKGAALSQTVPLQGRVREIERLRSATLTVTAPGDTVLAGQIRETERLRGATLTASLSLQGRARQTERLRGAVLTISVPGAVALEGRLRVTERLKGADLTVTAPVVPVGGGGSLGTTTKLNYGRHGPAVSTRMERPAYMDRQTRKIAAKADRADRAAVEAREAEARLRESMQERWSDIERRLSEQERRQRLADQRAWETAQRLAAEAEERVAILYAQFDAAMANLEAKRLLADQLAAEQYEAEQAQAEAEAEALIALRLAILRDDDEVLAIILAAESS